MSDLDRAADDERGLLAAVARAYYLEDISRIDIAEKLGISRFKVARLLARARQEQIVTITINDAGLPDAPLGERLRETLGLAACHVVRSHGEPNNVRRQIGAAAARLLSATLRPSEVLGVTWGRTLKATTSQLEHLPRLSVVQLTGFVAGDLSSSPLEVVRDASKRSGGDIYPMFAPLYVQDRATAEGLRRHPDIRAAMDLYPSITTALLSIGSWSPTDTTVRDVLDLEDLSRAIAGGCVADVAGTLIGEDGELVDPELQERCIAIPYEQLKKVPRIVAVAGGAAKAAAIRAAARAGLVTELVTDHELALAVLALA
ncbi:sugar-binding domain-containing protein [Sinomonas sp. ASV322]|uniref:sugar-binding transcriptional regulator n=1 Tax=Sinomonas sp. ASV322 TaxID=3041920 RepID=UPI0027DB631D|nr:sugar-binding domain-containing protein [Sinomonas sp. ASV322]MDQ4501286.1 sugar-binding domain-containing protein [Sinomonas sp. ASV322]